MVPVGGVPMLTRVLAAVANAALPGPVASAVSAAEDGKVPRPASGVEVVVVGPGRAGVPWWVRVVQEEPARGGPVAAIAAGVASVRAETVVVLAADLPYLLPEAVELLVAELGRGGADGVVFVDGGRRQLLCGAWRTGALRLALERLGTVNGRAMRELAGGLVVREIAWLGGGMAPYFDCDTEDDLRRAEGLE